MTQPNYDPNTAAQLQTIELRNQLQTLTQQIAEIKAMAASNQARIGNLANDIQALKSKPAPEAPKSWIEKILGK